MAIALVRQSSATNTGSQTAITVTLTGTPAAGALLVACIASDKSAGTYTAPTGFTQVRAPYVATSVSGGIWYKVAVGNEATVVFSQSSASPNGLSAWVGEYSDVNTLDVTAVAGDETTVTSRATGTTATTAVAAELAVAIDGCDSGNSIVSGRAWTNSFAEQAFKYGGTAGNPGLSVAHLVLAATQTVTSTFSYTGTADQNFGMVATFRYLVAGTGAADIDAPAVAGTGKETFSATGGVDVDAPALAGTGNVGSAGVTGTGAIVIAAAAVAGTGKEAFGGSGGVDIDAPTLSGTGVESVIGTGAIGIDAPSVVGTGSVSPEAVIGTGAVTIAAPSVSGTGSGGTPVVITEAVSSGGRVARRRRRARDQFGYLADPEWMEPPPLDRIAVTGTGAVVVAGPTVRAVGAVSDDELAIAVLLEAVA